MVARHSNICGDITQALMQCSSITGYMYMQFVSASCCAVVGQPQSQDAVVWAEPDHPSWMTGAEVSDDGRCACVNVDTVVPAPVDTATHLPVMSLADTFLGRHCTDCLTPAEDAVLQTRSMHGRSPL